MNQMFCHDCQGWIGPQEHDQRNDQERQKPFCPFLHHKPLLVCDSRFRQTAVTEIPAVALGLIHFAVPPSLLSFFMTRASSRPFPAIGSTGTFLARLLGRPPLLPFTRLAHQGKASFILRSLKCCIRCRLIRSAGLCRPFIRPKSQLYFNTLSTILITIFETFRFFITLLFGVLQPRERLPCFSFSFRTAFPPFPLTRTIRFQTVIQNFRNVD